jgi:hypothetical protein
LIPLFTWDPSTSTYQRAKIVLLSMVDLSKDAVHIYIGFGCLVATLILMRGRVRWKGLLPGLILSLAMEAADLRDDYRTRGRLRWAASAHDVVNTNAIPLMLVALLRRRWVKGS